MCPSRVEHLSFSLFYENNSGWVVKRINVRERGCKEWSGSGRGFFYHRFLWPSPLSSFLISLSPFLVSILYKRMYRKMETWRFTLKYVTENCNTSNLRTFESQICWFNNEQLNRTLLSVHKTKCHFEVNFECNRNLG